MKHHPAALTEGPIARTLVLFTLPILYGYVLQSLNGSVNSIWVGKFLGESALTATANAGALMFLLLGSIFGLSMASTILVAQHFGARRPGEARRVIGTSATFFAVLAVTLCVAGWLLCDRLLAWMSTPADAIPYARDYLRIVFVALPPLFMYTFVMAVLRGAGDSKTPFKFLLLSVAIDIALNPVLIFGVGPIPPLGIAGAGLAMLVANVVSLVALVAHLYRRRHEVCLHGDDLRLLRIDGAIVGTLLRKGVPMGLQMIVISASGIVMITLVNRFGSETTAAYGAVWQLWNYVQMPAFAVGAAVSSMAAQNVGANRWDRVGRTAKAGVALHLALTGALVLACFALNRQALGLFLRPGTALEIAMHVNAVATWSFLMFGISMVLFGAVRATGAVLPPLVVLFFALWVVRFPFSEMMLPAWGADAIWWSFPLSALVAATLSVAYYRWGGWRRARMTQAVPVAAGESAG